jgi:F-type H+-transporting ATPase subunit a
MINLIAMFIYSLFFFVLFANLVGNIPYSFVITTSAIVCLSLSFTIFLGVTILGISIHNLNLFSFFIPVGTPLILVPVLTIIEFISYIARAFSLGVRLFANLVAGHSLMKILSTFLFKLFSSSILIFIITLLPFTIFIALCGLELAVSVIQTYVFCLLVTSYLKDAIDLH